MKRRVSRISAIIMSACILFSIPVYADDIDGMSIEELKESYRQLESENEELRSELDMYAGEGDIGTDDSESAPVSYESKVVVLHVNEEQQLYDAAVEIKNTGTTNLNLGGYSTFSLEDEDGKLLAYEDSSAICAMPRIIRPGEVGYIFGNNLASGEAKDGKCNLKFDDSYFSSTSFEPEEFDAVQTSVQGEGYSSIIGRVVLGDSDYSGDVNILCLYYDKDGNIVLADGALAEVSPDDDNSFEVYTEGIGGFGLNIDSYKLFVQSEEPY